MHAHHILFKKRLGESQQALVAEGQELLRKVGIDPIYGFENIVWAPNRIVGQHRLDALLTVVEKLRELDAIGADYDDVTKALKKLGQLPADR